MRLRDLRLELWLTAGLLVYNLLFLGWFGLLDVDEAIFAEATREMIETGDYITPRYNGGVRWDKPPLIYWCMSAPMRLLGPTPVGARAWSAIAGALCGLILMLFGRLVFDRRTGLLAALIMAGCLHGFALSHMSITDMTLSWLMAGGTLALILATESARARWYAVAGLSIGLATLTKGPVAVVLPGFAWLVWLGLTRRLALLLKPTWWLGPAVCVAVIVPWCVAIYWYHQWEFFRGFLGYHNLNRLTTTQSSHGGPIYTYVLILAGGLLPWTGFALAGCVDAWRRRSDGAAGRAALALLCAAGCTLALFSVSRTKLPNYIAPAYPLLALLAARVAAEAVGEPTPRRWGWLWFLNLGGFLAVGAVLATLAGWLDRIPGLTDMLRRELSVESVDIGPGPALAGAMMLILGVAPLLLWLRRRPRAAVGALAAAGLGAGLSLWIGVAPVIYRYQQGTLRVMSHVAAARTSEAGELCTLNVHVPSLPFVTRRLFTRLTIPKDDPAGPTLLKVRFARPDPVFLITRERRAGPLLDGLICYDWGRRDGWRLISNQPPPPGWALPPSPWREAEADWLEKSL